MTIPGADLLNDTLTLDGLPATCIVDSTNQIPFTTPAYAEGPVDVAVTTRGGSATAVHGFIYRLTCIFVLKWNDD
jgi:large repetitive protein